MFSFDLHWFHVSVRKEDLLKFKSSHLWLASFKNTTTHNNYLKGATLFFFYVFLCFSLKAHIPYSRSRFKCSSRPIFSFQLLLQCVWYKRAGEGSLISSLLIKDQKSKSKGHQRHVLLWRHERLSSTKLRMRTHTRRKAHGVLLLFFCFFYVTQ